ncbi:MAG: DUF3488 domain-containing protein [Leucobacter sp.]
MTPRVRLASAAVASALAVALGVLAAWPIYRTPWLLLPAAVGLVLGVGIAALSARRRWGALVTAAVLIVGFAVTVVPVAVPEAFERLPQGLLRGFLDGLAAIVLGWKQLLTLALPVGSYQTMLVPAYLVFLVTSFTITIIALRAGRFAPLAAFAMALPVAFGTVFGASELSAPLILGPLVLSAPREIGLWIAAAALGACWVAWTSGAERRAALRRGRLAGGPRLSGGRAVRVVIAALTVVVGLAAGFLVSPALAADAREVPRDRIDPEIVVRERPSPLAAYRGWKRDDTLDAPLFEVSAEGELPARLRLAVLDAYDGVDFHVDAGTAGRFTRFPSGDPVREPIEVAVRVGEGYSDIWAPTAQLGSAPSFTGPRANELADAFYVNRGTGAAIAVPGGTGSSGLIAGDGYRATMSAAPDVQLAGSGSGPVLDLEAMPELAAWLEAQDQPATAEGLIELVQRLRDRGYLSHSISDREGERLWLDRLAAEHGTGFEPSAGGHSAARLEQLFAQLNTQQRLAGDDARPAALVAGIGDDEQFAAAAALLARALGFESRVVLGVRLGDERAGVPGVPACERVCTGEHLAAWIEVRGQSGEWAPIDTTPQLELRPTTLEEGEQLPEFPTTPEERDAREVDPPLGVGESSDQLQQNEPPAIASWLWPTLRAVGLSLLALLLLALPVLFLPFAKRWRSRVRKAETDPELRALAAWQEMVDGAVDQGVRIPAGASRSEIAAILGTAPARWAAQQVDRAVFSPAGIAEQDADWLWAAVEADRRERAGGLGRWRRLRAVYALRSYGVRIAVPWGRAGESAGDASAGNAVPGEVSPGMPMANEYRGH